MIYLWGVCQNVEFVRNYDGDTIIFNIPNQHHLIGAEIPVRVEGVDTPEIKGKTECEQHYAKIVRDKVNNELVSAKIINLINLKRGSFFRIVADVIYDGNSLREYLLELDGVLVYSSKNKFICPKRWKEL